MSKSQQKRICTQSECVYRDELERQLEAYREVIDAAKLWKIECYHGICADNLVEALASLQGRNVYAIFPNALNNEIASYAGVPAPTGCL